MNCIKKKSFFSFNNIEAVSLNNETKNHMIINKMSENVLQQNIHTEIIESKQPFVLLKKLIVGEKVKLFCFKIFLTFKC